MIITIKSSTQENILKNNLFAECLPCHLKSVYENTIHRKYILKVPSYKSPSAKRWLIKCAPT